MTRAVNQAGRDLIIFFEGRKLYKYNDVAGYATIGIGHKCTPSDRIPTVISTAAMFALFEQDLAIAAGTVEQCVKTDISDNSFAALTSFCFNLGERPFAHSTLLSLVNNKQFSAAAAQFERWVYADGHKIDGLVRRREAERLLFLKP